ncbi:MAG: hypothetical protein ACI8QC_000195 [Planctomycetota bacterium]|jgi:hypothetical protein
MQDMREAGWDPVAWVSTQSLIGRNGPLVDPTWDRNLKPGAQRLSSASKHAPGAYDTRFQAPYWAV